MRRFGGLSRLYGQAGYRREEVLAVGAATHRVDHALGREEEAAWKRVARLRDGVRQYSRTVMTP